MNHDWEKLITKSLGKGIALILNTLLAAMKWVCIAYIFKWVLGI